jgi:hypothetical protein
MQAGFSALSRRLIVMSKNGASQVTKYYAVQMLDELVVFATPMSSKLV